ncbi:MAG TPA: hypothetical protein VLA34_11670, partial [Candidatus Krumholzibacterium sp.]|nr:hypothetical protein [Candidatus Krumholzibacterium sp.]
DVYDVMENNVEPPPLELLAHYKNVVWTYSNAQGLCAWRKLLLRTNFDSPVNYLPMFMASGGHLWTLGRSDLSVSGLKGVLPDGALLPAHVGCPDYGGYCSFDPMPSRDYGVTAVDCVLGHFRTDGYMPYRSLERDAARYMYRDDSDPVALAHPGMPGPLELSEEVTCPVCFWDPDERGFYYVEVYDPYYWMSIFAMMTSYIHPMYRMKSRNTLSPLNDQAVALWVTRYQDVVPAPAAGPAVAAPSAHMGFPLWFFDHDQAGQVADVIFGAWGIGQ